MDRYKVTSCSDWLAYGFPIVSLQKTMASNCGTQGFQPGSPWHQRAAHSEPRKSR